MNSNVNESFIVSNTSFDNESVKASLKRLRNFPQHPRVNSGKSIPIKNVRKNSPIANNKTRNQAKASSSKEASSPGQMESVQADHGDNNNIHTVLNDVVNVLKGLVEQVSQFQNVLKKFETDFSSTVGRVTSLEKEVENTKRHQESIEQRLTDLEAENTRLNNILINQRSEDSIDSSPRVSTNELDVSNLQREIDNLHQEKRANEIILSGNLIKSKIKH